jgi:hypothetical protein
MICWPFPLHRPATSLRHYFPLAESQGGSPWAIDRSPRLRGLLSVICRKPYAEGCDPGEQSHHRHQE